MGVRFCHTKILEGPKLAYWCDFKDLLKLFSVLSSPVASSLEWSPPVVTMGGRKSFRKLFRALGMGFYAKIFGDRQT